jgi:hypothetical protein
MKTIIATIRFKRHGMYENTKDYNVQIPEETKEDNETEVIMDAVRPILQREYEDDEDWENGDMEWTLHSWY